jgi:hypothetical protein
MTMTKQQLKAMIHSLNRTLQNNPLKTPEDHADFKTVQIRYNDLLELFWNL